MEWDSRTVDETLNALSTAYHRASVDEQPRLQRVSKLIEGLRDKRPATVTVVRSIDSEYEITLRLERPLRVDAVYTLVPLDSKDDEADRD